MGIIMESRKYPTIDEDKKASTKYFYNNNKYKFLKHLHRKRINFEQ